MSKELTWRKDIEKVLSEAAGAVHYDDITDAIVTQKMRTNLVAPCRSQKCHSNPL